MRRKNNIFLFIWVKIVKRYKSVKTKDILKHIISVIPELIDKYLNYVEETDTPDQMKAKTHSAIT